MNKETEYEDPEVLIALLEEEKKNING